MNQFKKLFVLFLLLSFFILEFRSDSNSTITLKSVLVEVLVRAAVVWFLNPFPVPK